MANIDVFLCDYLQRTGSGKVDILGTNVTPIITIPILEYADGEVFGLERTIVVKLEVDEVEASSYIDKVINVSYSFCGKDINIDTEVIHNQPIGKEIHTGTIFYSFEKSGEKNAFKVRNEGTLSIEVKIEGLFEKKLNFKITDALHVTPYSTSQLLIPTAGILGPLKEEQLPLSRFIENALDEIILVDQYLDPKALTEILGCLKNNALKIKVLTNENLKSQYRVQNLFNKYKNIEVRFDDTIHDRFLVIGADVYAFGYSFKDLPTKYSYFSQIRLEEQYKKIMEIINNVWETSEKLGL